MLSIEISVEELSLITCALLEASVRLESMPGEEDRIAKYRLLASELPLRSK